MSVPTPTTTAATNTSDAPNPNSTLSHAAAVSTSPDSSANDPAAAVPASNTNTTPTPTHPIPPTAASLPPAALDLAAKLFAHARTGATSVLHTYLAAGIPPNLTNHAGDTLLMLAAYHGHADTVRMLLSHHADPNATNARGQSPLAGAVFKGYRDVVSVLVEGGADPEAGQPCARDAAVMFGRREIWEILGVEEGRWVPGLVKGGKADVGEGGGCPV